MLLLACAPFEMHAHTHAHAHTMLRSQCSRAQSLLCQFKKPRLTLIFSSTANNGVIAGARQAEDGRPPRPPGGLFSHGRGNPGGVAPATVPTTSQMSSMDGGDSEMVRRKGLGWWPLEMCERE